MTPFWIINFLKKDSQESFFATYWKAYLQQQITPNENPDEPLKFFYITDGADDKLTKEKLSRIATQELSMDNRDSPKLIPAFKENEHNSINVFFIGDITQPKTIERLHLWAAYLRKEYNRNRWHSIYDVKMYAILLRPASITVDEDVLTSNVRGFLNELSTLEKMDINYRPFNQVLFIQAPLNKEGREDAEYATSLAAYHIARTDGHCFEDRIRYYDTSVSAVFYESNVQRGIDAYDLSVVMLKDFTENSDEFFYEVNEARQFVADNKQIFTDTLTPAHMKLNFVMQCPSFPEISKIIALDMIQGYDERQFDIIISNFEKKVRAFHEDYCQKLSKNQVEFVRDRSFTLRKLVFEMFLNLGQDGKFRHIGLVQSLKVLELFSDDIQDAFRTTDTKPTKAFECPQAIVNVLKSSDKPEDILKKLKANLIDFKSFKNKLGLLTGLATILVGVVMTIVLFPIGLLFALLGPAIGWLIYKNRINRIETLKKQYIAAIVDETHQKLCEEIDKHIEKTQQEIRQYCKWLRDRKLKYLQENMSVLLPPKFMFRVSKMFQPLLSADFEEAIGEQLLQSKDIDLLNFIGHLSRYGSFGKYPIVKDVPGVNIETLQGDTVDIADLIHGHKDTVQGLIQELLTCEEHLEGGVVEDVAFKKHEYSSLGRKMLLLLDVSGSMSADMTDLKQYVEDLSQIGEIEWIAFADNVVATSDEKEVEVLSAGGGTNYIPAIIKATEWLKEKDFDDIILLSDGYPFEPLYAIIDAANKLAQPLNTISIGMAAKNVLEEIANETGGDSITVDSFADIRSEDKWKNEILPHLSQFKEGDYRFGELMKYTQVPACALLLQRFAISKIQRTSLTIPQLLTTYLNPQGLNEWLVFTAKQRNTLNPAYNPECSFSLATAKTNQREIERMEDLLMKEYNNLSMIFSEEEPDMIASLMALRPLAMIGQLQWVASMEHDDATINESETLKELIGKQTKVVNIYDEEIKA